MFTEHKRRRWRWPGRLAAPALAAGLVGFACQATPPAVDTLRFPVWSLAEEPIFSITGSAEAPAFDLFRVAFGLFLDDDEIVVTNLTTNLILLDTLGRARRIVGRAGAGPGEFERIDQIIPTGDGFAVADIMMGRVSFYSRAGDFLHTTTSPIRDPRAAGYLLEPAGLVIPTRGQPGEPVRYEVRDRHGELQHELVGPLRPPPPPSLQYPSPDGRGVTMGPTICVPMLRSAVIGSSLIVVDDRGVITRVEPSGENTEVYRVAAPARVTPLFLDSMRNQLGGGAIPKDTVDAVLGRAFVLDEPRQLWDRVVADPAAGRLWLQRSGCPGWRPGTWDVIDLEGNELGTIVLEEGLQRLSQDRRMMEDMARLVDHVQREGDRSLPQELQYLRSHVQLADEIHLMAARGDRLLVRRTDWLGVEHLELYRIRR